MSINRSSIRTSVFPSKYIQGPGALQRLGELTNKFGGKAFITTPQNIFDSIVTKHVIPFLPKEQGATYEIFQGEVTNKEVERLSTLAKSTHSDVIIGIGGGKAIDVSKAVAHHLHCRVICCPTIASTDAPCSALSVIYTEDGVMESFLALRSNPDAVVVDTSVIINAPTRFLVAGMGDALSTFFEAQSCQQSCSPNVASPTDCGAFSSYVIAEMCWKALCEFGKLAMLASNAHAIVPAFERIVEANTLLSGLGFESAGLATAHSIHDGLTKLPETHAFLHGEKVAIGTLASLFLTDKPRELINKVYSFCEEVGLPTTLAEIGLKNVSVEQLNIVAQRACERDSRIHCEPHFISQDAVVNALLMADAFGKNRKLK